MNISVCECYKKKDSLVVVVFMEKVITDEKIFSKSIEVERD